MDKSKHLQPKDYDQFIADCMAEPDYNISEFLESKYSEHYQANANFMKGIESAFDREESSGKYDNIKHIIAANNGNVSDDRLDKLKLIAMWGEVKKQQIQADKAKEILDRVNQKIKHLAKVFHEVESAPDFNSLFVIDPKSNSLQQGESVVSIFNIEKQHRFNISNKSIVDESGIKKEASVKYYISELIYLLSEILKASEIPDFLEYHYQNADDKTGMINFVSFDLWDFAKDQIPPHRKELIMQWTAKEKQDSTQPQALHTNFDAGKLNQIFDRLQARKITNKADKIKFAAMFTDGSTNKVYWNDTIRGAKAGLFDLMARITGKELRAAELKLRFGASVHDKWKDKSGKPSKLIDEIMKGF